MSSCVISFCVNCLLRRLLGSPMGKFMGWQPKGRARATQGARNGRARGAQGARKGRAGGAQGARKGRARGAQEARNVRARDALCRYINMINDFYADRLWNHWGFDPIRRTQT